MGGLGGELGEAEGFEVLVSGVCFLTAAVIDHESYKREQPSSPGRPETPPLQLSRHLYS